jgi:hypothetical protein
MLTKEDAVARRASSDRLTSYREAVRKSLDAYASDLGVAIIEADARGDEEDRRQHAASLTQVRSAQRVLYMN